MKFETGVPAQEIFFCVMIRNKTSSPCLTAIKDFAFGMPCSVNFVSWPRRSFCFQLSQPPAKVVPVAILLCRPIVFSGEKPYFCLFEKIAFLNNTL